MNLDNGKGALERRELLLDGRLANVDQIINVLKEESKSKPRNRPQAVTV
jgi:hypothetical protein